MISVVIPTFDRAHLLPRAMESVRCQTLAPDEVIVVDDGSTDDTERLVAERYPEVRYLSQPHAGVSAARNRGLAAARGKPESVQAPAVLQTNTVSREFSSHRTLTPSPAPVVSRELTALRSAVPSTGPVISRSLRAVVARSQASWLASASRSLRPVRPAAATGWAATKPHDRRLQ